MFQKTGAYHGEAWICRCKKVASMSEWTLTDWY